MVGQVGGVPMARDEFNLYEMWLVAQELLRDFDCDEKRRLDVAALAGAGRDIAQKMWRQDLAMRERALLQRAWWLVDMMVDAGVLPREPMVIGLSGGYEASRMCRNELLLLERLLWLRVADGECYRGKRRPPVVSAPAPAAAGAEAS